MQGEWCVREDVEDLEEWLVGLRGKLFDLQQLPNLFVSPEATVVEEHGLYYLKSIDFSHLIDASDVLKNKGHTLEVMNGAAILHLENIIPV